MSDIDLDAIEARANAATDGPWWHYGDGFREIHGPQNDEEDGWAPQVAVAGDDGTLPDAEFIAHARTDIPALVAEVRRLREVREEWRRLYSNAVAERDGLRAQVEAVRHILSSGYADFQAFQADLRAAVALDVVLDAATATAEELARAWDEGHRAGEMDGSYRLAVNAGLRPPAPGHSNPYRPEEAP